MDLSTAPESLAQRFARLNAQTTYRDKLRENQRLERIMQAQGADPTDAETPKEGFLPKLLDTLNTPAQWVEGVVAKLTNTPEYGNLGFLEAAQKGAAENISTGEILRKNDIFNSNDFLTGKLPRTVLGFVGDVALDPTTYLTLGAGQGLKVGGKVLANDALSLASNARTALGLSETVAKEAGVDGLTKLKPSQIYHALTAQAEETAVNNVKKSLLKGDFSEEAFKNFVSDAANAKIYDVQSAAAKAEAASNAAQGFREAASIAEQSRKYSKSEKAFLNNEAVKKELGAQFDYEAVQKQAAGRVRQKLGLAEDVPLEELFAPPAIRWTGFWNRTGGDIPVVTPFSQAAFQALDGPLYGARMKMSETFDKGVQFALNRGKTLLADNPNSVSGSAWNLTGQVANAIRNFPRLISVNASAGSELKASRIEQHRVAQAANLGKAMDLVDPHFEEFYKVGGKDDDISLMLRAYQSGVKGKNQIDTALRDQVVQATANKLNADRDGVGDAALNVLNTFRGHMDELALDATQRGTIGGIVQDYVPGLYETAKKGMGDEPYKQFIQRNFGGENPSFGFEKIIASLGDAENVGLMPVTDLRKIWTNRVYQQLKFNEATDFAERMAFEVGMPRPTYNAIKELVASKNEKVSAQAIELLRQRGVTADLGEAQKSLGQALMKSEEFHGFRGPSGEIMSPEDLARLRQRASLPGVAGDEARTFAENQGLHIPEAAPLDYKLADPNIAAQQFKDIEDFHGLYQQHQAGLLGRAGETLTTRAGADLLSQEVRDKIWQHLGPEEAKFFDNVLPTHFVNAVKESLDTQSTLTKISKWAEKTNSPLSQAAKSAAAGYFGWVKMLKYGTTQIWPSYHIGNLTGALLQGIDEAPVIGNALNIQRLMRSYQLHSGAGQIIQKGTGKILSARQLASEVEQMGLKVKGIDALELVKAQGDMFATQLKNGAKEIARREKAGTLSKVWDVLKSTPGNVGSFIETFGREHVYYYLREQGLDPVSASQAVSRIMINYGGGKTAFEKHVLNNTIFFYSFAKGQAMNTLHAAVTRPGALTAQLHAIDGVKEMLMDVHAPPVPPDLQDQVQTMRSQDSISRFLGRSERGNPLMLTNSGVPMESLSDFAQIRLPKTYSVGGLLEAAGDSIVDTTKKQLSSLNPILKTPLELLFNKSLYFDRPLTDQSMRKVAKLSPGIEKLTGYKADSIPGEVFKGLDEAVRKVLKGTDNGDGTFTVSPGRLAALQMIPVMNRGLSTYNAVLNQQLTTADKAARLTGRARVVEVDPAKSLVFERNRLLKDKIEELGLASSRKRLMQRQALLNEQDNQ